MSYNEREEAIENFKEFLALVDNLNKELSYYNPSKEKIKDIVILMLEALKDD